MTNTITIAGRKFRAVKNSTMRHDVWIQAQIARTGLDRMTMLPDEKPGEFALRMFREAASNGDVFLVLGGLLIPDEVESLKWTPEIAEETARFLGDVEDPEDKAAIRRELVSLLLGFFVKGLSFSANSPSYSSGAEAESAEPNSATEASRTSAIGD